MNPKNFDKNPAEAASEAGGSFIGAELRVDAADEEDSPVITSQTSGQEIRRRAGEALGPLLRSMLGSAPLAPQDVCRRSSEVSFAEVDGEAVLLDLRSGHYYTLNQQGTVIWQLLTGSCDLGAVADLLCERYEVDRETAWQDLVALVHNLCCEKLATLEAPDRGRL